MASERVLVSTIESCSNLLSATGNGVLYAYILGKHSYKHHLSTMVYTIYYFGHIDAFPIILIILWPCQFRKVDTT